MVHQHFMLIPVMTVAENIVLGVEPRDGLLLDERSAEQRVRELSERFGLAVDPTALVSDITVGQEQRVEILKALYRGADVLILDEPTAVLTPQEATELFAIVNSLKADGKSIIFISHKLNEVLEIADRITVLRRGKKIETVPREGATEESLARAMVGREVLLRVEKSPAQPGEVLLVGRGPPRRRRPRHREGARRLVRRARGRDRRHRRRRRQRPDRADRRDHRPPQDRERHGRGRGAEARARKRARHARRRRRPHSRRTASGAASCSSSRSPRTSRCTTTRKPPDAKWGWLFPARMIERRAAPDPEFDVRGGGPLTRAGGLSGGNQQKVVAAREIARDPKVLIAAQPTRGLDVGAIEYLHRRIVAERDEGRAVLLISLELEEILSLSDRILVIYEGEIVGEHTGEVSEEQIGLEMLGGRRSARQRDRRTAEHLRPKPPGGGGHDRAIASRRLALKQRAGGIVVPAVTAVVAFLIGGLVVLATGHNPLLAYRDIFNGAGLNWIFHPTTNPSRQLPPTTSRRRCCRRRRSSSAGSRSRSRSAAACSTSAARASTSSGSSSRTGSATTSPA